LQQIGALSKGEQQMFGAQVVVADPPRLVEDGVGNRHRVGITTLEPASPWPTFRGFRPGGAATAER
jgi:hypothetical protein